MLRAFLALALLLRIAIPAEAGGMTHCAALGTAAPAVPMDHHHPTDGTTPPASDGECSHCPPIDCARQLSCQIVGVVLAATETAPRGAPPVSGVLPAGALTVWHSVDSKPPTPPPVISLV